MSDAEYAMLSPTRGSIQSAAVHVFEATSERGGWEGQACDDHALPCPVTEVDALGDLHIQRQYTDSEMRKLNGSKDTIPNTWQHTERSNASVCGGSGSWRLNPCCFLACRSLPCSA
jgi:hypothetical protein